MKKKILLGIIITILLVAVVAEGIIIFTQSKNNDKSEETKEIVTQETAKSDTTEKPTEKPTAVPSLSVSKGEDLTITREYLSSNNKKKVYTYMKITVEENNLNATETTEYKLVYKIPQINIQSSDVTKINDTILKKVENKISDIEENQCIDLNYEGLEYEYFENDNILSLVLYVPTEAGGIFECDIYNVDIKTGKQLLNEELVKKIGVDGELSNMIMNSMNKKAEKTIQEFNEESDDIEFKTRVNTAIQLAMSADINNYKLYINQDKHLCMYIKTVNLTLAGGDEGTYLFDLENESEIYR